MQNTTFTFLLALGILFLAAFDSSARRGYVRTRDGRVLEGHLRFESNLVIIVDAAKEFRAEVTLTNLAGMGFDPETPSPTKVSTESSLPLPLPWRVEDVGSMREAGEVQFRDGVFRTRSTGTNVLGDGDSFHFLHKPVSGESELVARILRVQCVDPWARAGVMFRAGLGAEARHVFLAITAARGGSIASREHRGGETTIAVDGSRGSWIKLKRDGGVITAFRSVDARRWHVVDKISMPFDEEISAGLAVVGGRDGAVAEATFDNVEEGPSLRNRSYVPEIELKSGSVQMGYIERLDDTSVHFDPAERRVPASTPNVALIRFQPVPGRLGPLVGAGRQGVLLATGEFVEGECGGIAGHRVVINSVPLGLKRYDVNNEVIAIVLGKRAMVPARAFEVRTIDGSTWLGSGISLDRDGLLLREPI
ncbi:MAG: hypothetical protein QOF48_3174, partial [Verrucomicrobiota bacterium]